MALSEQEKTIQHSKFNIQNFTTHPGLFLALIIPIFAIMPLLTHRGLPNTADGPAHLMRQVELNRAWQEGIYYPRWGPDLALGHGMPIFSYAPPLLYQLTQLFHLTGLPLDESMKAVVMLDFLLYSVGMFLFARRVYGPAPALVAAAVYVYAPYRLREAYIQGNYGQFTGLALYPLIFWSFHALLTESRLKLAYLLAGALSLAGLLVSHNISTMLFGPVFAAYVLFLSLRPDVRLAATRFLRTAGAGLLGLGLSAIFWLPAFGEKETIKLEGITRGFFDFRQNFISLGELLSPPVPLDLSAINPEFPLSLGLPQMLAAAVAILGLGFTALYRRRSISSSPRLLSNAPSPTAHTLFFILFLLLYAFLALPVSQPVWEAVPLLELAEFPWRMLGPAIFCAAVLAAPAFQSACRIPYLARRPVLSLTIALLLPIILNLYYLYPSQFISWGTPGPADAFRYEVVSGAIGTTSTGEFLPRGAQQPPSPDALWPDYEAGRPPQKLDPASLPPDATVKIIAHRVQSNILRVTTPVPFTATLRTLYWPGWQVYLDGQAVAFSVRPNTGLIETAIPAGEHTLTLKLESTPLRTLGRWSTLISALILLGLGLSALFLQSPNLQSQIPQSPNLQSLFLASLLIAAYFLTRPLEPLFVLRSNPDRPRPADRVLQVDFDDQLRLVGMDDLPQTVWINGRDPSELEAVVYWRALYNLDTNYAVFLHLDTTDGRTVAAVDERHPDDIPTRNWPPGLYLRNSLRLKIPGDLPPIRYSVTVGLYNPNTGQRLPIAGTDRDTYPLAAVWLAGPEPALPRGSVARFGPHIQLRQANYNPPNRTLLLYWQTDSPIDRPLTIFVHLLDRAGNLLAQADGVPYSGLYPPADWRVGQVITDIRHLPETAPPPAAIAIGIYEPDTGTRLPAVDSSGIPLPNNSYILRVGDE